MVVSRRRSVTVLVVSVVLAFGVVGANAAHSPNKGWVTENWSQTNYTGYVQVQPCYLQNGQNAMAGWLRFTREAGPALDTGRLYTATGTGPNDCRILKRQKFVWDSPLWGAQYVTHFDYNFVWTNPNGPWSADT